MHVSMWSLELFLRLQIFMSLQFIFQNSFFLLIGENQTKLNLHWWRFSIAFTANGKRQAEIFLFDEKQ